MAEDEASTQLEFEKDDSNLLEYHLRQKLKDERSTVSFRFDMIEDEGSQTIMNGLQQESILSKKKSDGDGSDPPGRGRSPVNLKDKGIKPPSRGRSPVRFTAAGGEPIEESGEKPRTLSSRSRSPKSSRGRSALGVSVVRV